MYAAFTPRCGQMKEHLEGVVAFHGGGPESPRAHGVGSKRDSI